MLTLFIVLHVCICIFLVLIVLLQPGKGGMGAAFGGGSSQAILGSRGAAPLLSKLTTGLAIAFMLSSVLLAYMSSSKKSVMEGMGSIPAAQEQKNDDQTEPAAGSVGETKGETGNLPEKADTPVPTEGAEPVPEKAPEAKAEDKPASPSTESMEDKNNEK